MLRLRGGGVEAEAPSPAPAPPLYPLPLDAARRAATAAAADAMDGVPPVSMEGRRVRRARDVFDPSTEWARPEYGEVDIVSIISAKSAIYPHILGILGTKRELGIPNFVTSRDPIGSWESKICNIVGPN